MRKIILNEAFGILALAVLLVPQIAHTVYVFKVNSQYMNPWFGWCYAVGVDLAILIFTVKGWIRTAIVYFLGTLAHNVVYQFWPESIWSAVLICLMLSGTIFSFSHLFYFKKDADQRKVGAEQERITAHLEQLTAALAAGVRFEALPYQCPQCGQAHATSKQLNGHISGHKQIGDWNPESYKEWEEENRQRKTLAEGAINELKSNTYEN